MLPWAFPVVGLMVDGGKASGWAIMRGVPVPPVPPGLPAHPLTDDGVPAGYARGVEVIEHGECSAWETGPDLVCKRAVELGAAFCALEEPGMGGRAITPSQLVGLGESIGIWRRAWRLAYGSRSRDFDVPVQTWRGAILGDVPHVDGQDRTSEWKAAARAFVVDGVVHASGSTPWGMEDADAAAMGSYVLRAMAIGYRKHKGGMMPKPSIVDVVGARELAKAGWTEEAALASFRKAVTS